MKKYLFLICLCIFLSGCIGQPSSNDTTEAQLVEDPFVETTAEILSPENPVPSWELPGVTLHGYAGEMPLDDLGTYLVYEGGQMHLELALQARGLSEAGVGVLLFLDGQPQPFSLEENGAYEYMHIVNPGLKKADGIVDAYFTPIVGDAGDVLEITYLLIIHPLYSIDDDNDEKTSAFVHATTRPGIVTRLKFNAAPPAQTFPEIDDKLICWSAEWADLTSLDTYGWTDADYREEVRSKIEIDGYEDPGISYETTADEPIPLHFELLGAPTAEFGVVIYLDNQPVSVDPEDIMLVHTQHGQKLILDAQIDFSDFDGESVIYVALVPRNFRTAQLGTSCDMSCFYFYWFSDAPEPAGYHRK